MTIFLFSDFGAADIYIGQVKSVLHQHAPNVKVIDLLHEAPCLNVKAGAHLLAALIRQLPPESVIFAVVDPGVGSARAPVVVQADRRWYAGPDNGLLSVVAGRARTVRIFPVAWKPEKLSASFHGRDLFAAVAAALATGVIQSRPLPEMKPRLDVDFGADDLAEIIYVDHYGNALTGLRASGTDRAAHLVAAGRRISYARVFAEVPPGATFWYENSLGLIEVAANGANAASLLGLKIGDPVARGV